MHKMLKIFGFILLFFPSILLGQEAEKYQTDNILYNAAEDLFYKKKYANAQKLYEEIIKKEADEKSELAVAANYYRAVCALNLFNRDAEHLLKTFLKKYPDSRWTESIYYQLGTYSYRKKNYQDVVTLLSQVNPLKLDESERSAYYFKLGFSNFNLGYSQEALASFARIKDEQGDYYYPTNYYYGHLNYESGRYGSALESFNRIKEDENFKELVRYYIVHIYYKQKQYQDLLDYAIPLLQEEDVLRKEEIARLVGEAFYFKKDYERALPYLEEFSAGEIGRTEEDNYQLGYCNYKVGKYEKAIKYFNYLTNAEGEMGQTANYHLAECYLKTNQKKMARDAFRTASKTNFNKMISEDALFNFGKLAYELSYNPYQQAISAFEQYLNKYPNSDRVDEVNEILIYVYLTTRNYEAALASIEKIEKKDFRLQSAYQYLAYNRGVELFLAKNYQDALSAFQKVGVYQMEKKLITSSLFWQGECYYQQANYPLAVGAYTRFLRQGNAYGTGFYHKAQYNLGYAYFKQANYPKAKNYFRDFVTSKTKIEPNLICDGLTRTADCYFVEKDFLTASDFYTRAIKMNTCNNDYSFFQLALCQGYSDKLNDKIASLNNFEKRFPESAYVQDALFELGDAQFKNKNNDAALKSFNTLVDAYPDGQLAKKALLKSGLILYRNGEVEKALNTFKTIAERFSAFSESKEAIQRAEDIYVELGRINEYNDWVQTLSNVNITTAGLDSINFRAAENFFAKEDCEGTIDAFEQYLNRFENAIFATNAHFYMAECFYRSEAYDLAQQSYQYIVDQPDNKFTESALTTVAYLNFQDSAFQTALDQYKRLEKVASFKINRIQAKIGQMRCYKELDLVRETMDYANKVLFYSGIPEDIRIEAMFAKANAEKRLTRFEDAFNSYDTLANYTKSIEGAEARYNMAYIKFLQGNYPIAEEIIFEAVNMKPTYDLWLAKCFILLSDVYVELEDLFQAKATLQSVIDYHEGEELVNVARKKLDEILAKEAKDNEGESQEIDIQLNSEDEKYEPLFEVDSTDQATKSNIEDIIPAVEPTPADTTNNPQTKP